MTNREVIEKVIKAFEISDGESLMPYLTEDIEWQMRGAPTVNGKDGMLEFFKAHAYLKMLETTVNHFIINCDQAAVDGMAKCVGINGNIMEMYYCDLYELQDGKVRKMVSYCVDKKN